VSLRTKLHLLIFVVFPIGALTLGVLSMTVHTVFIFLAFAYTILIGLSAFLVRCPNCKARVIWQGYLLFPYLRKFCSCGYDLGQKRPKDKK